MPYTANLDGFENEDIAPIGIPKRSSISDAITRTLTRLLAFNRATKLYKPLICDVDGRLLVSSSPTQSTSVNHSAVTVNLVSTILMNDNPLRKQYIIQNLGANDIYVTFGTPALVATGFKIPQDGVFADDVYTGVITAIALVAGNDVHMVEM